MEAGSHASVSVFHEPSDESEGVQARAEVVGQFETEARMSLQSDDLVREQAHLVDRGVRSLALGRTVDALSVEVPARRRGGRSTKWGQR